MLGTEVGLAYWWGMGKERCTMMTKHLASQSVYVCMCVCSTRVHCYFIHMSMYITWRLTPRSGLKRVFCISNKQIFTYKVDHLCYTSVSTASNISHMTLYVLPSGKSKIIPHTQQLYATWCTPGETLSLTSNSWSHWSQICSAHLISKSLTWWNDKWPNCQLKQSHSNQREETGTLTQDISCRHLL